MCQKVTLWLFVALSAVRNRNILYRLVAIGNNDRPVTSDVSSGRLPNMVAFFVEKTMDKKRAGQLLNYNLMN